MKDAARRGQIEGAVQPARCSEHNQCMTSDHSTTARWIRLGVDLEEGGNRTARFYASRCTPWEVRLVSVVIVNSMHAVFQSVST